MENTVARKGTPVMSLPARVRWEKRTWSKSRALFGKTMSSVTINTLVPMEKHAVYFTREDMVAARSKWLGFLDKLMLNL
jgi:hypothetical protein